MNARDDILNRIKKKANVIKTQREKTSRDNSYRRILLTFLEDMDKHQHTCKEREDYNMCFRKELQLLYANMRSFCPSAGVKILWDDENANFPKVNAIIIKWPPEYVAKHPEVTTEECIDMSDLLFDSIGG